MKNVVCLFGLMLLLFACKKENATVPAVEIIPGGTGGTYNIAVFPMSGKFGVPGKCYIKYGYKSLPTGAVTYNDSNSTMVEPGYGPHVHFVNLKEGFYLITSIGNYNGNSVKDDTIVEIRSNQAKSVDCYMQLK